MNDPYGASDLTKDLLGDPMLVQGVLKAMKHLLQFGAGGDPTCSQFEALLRSDRFSLAVAGLQMCGRHSVANGRQD